MQMALRTLAINKNRGMTTIFFCYRSLKQKKDGFFIIIVIIF